MNIKKTKPISNTIKKVIKKEEEEEVKKKKEEEGGGVKKKEKKKKVNPNDRRESTSNHDESTLMNHHATRFMFYSNSKDAKPGMGSSEMIDESKVSEFKTLERIKHWRRMLSNFYSDPMLNVECHGNDDDNNNDVNDDGDKGKGSGNEKKRKRSEKGLDCNQLFAKCQFELFDLKWASVEHCFQAYKFKASHPQYYHTFALNSSSELSRTLNGNIVKKAGRKIKLNTSELQSWNQIKHQIMEQAHYAKFSQNEHLKNVLLATKDAILTHRPPRSKSLVIEYGLMKVRDKLAKQENKSYQTSTSSDQIQEKIIQKKDDDDIVVDDDIVDDDDDDDDDNYELQ